MWCENEIICSYFRIDILEFDRTFVCFHINAAVNIVYWIRSEGNVTCQWKLDVCIFLRPRPRGKLVGEVPRLILCRWGEHCSLAGKQKYNQISHANRLSKIENRKFHWEFRNLRGIQFSGRSANKRMGSTLSSAPPPSSLVWF